MKCLILLATLFGLTCAAVVDLFPGAYLSDAGQSPMEMFGENVAVSGSMVIVGAPQWGTNNQGAAFLYNCPTSTTCSLITMLQAPDAADEDQFGFAVAIDGGNVVVGAPFKTVGSNQFQGSAYYFSCSGSGCSAGLVIAQPGTAVQAAYDDFGTAVGISGNLVAVGCDQKLVNGNNGVGVVFVYSCSGSTCNSYDTLMCGDNCGSGGENFGHSVAVSGNWVAAGAPFTSVGSNGQQGETFVFDCTNSPCTLLSNVLAADGGDSDNFGTSVSLSGTSLLVGSPAANGTWDMQGAAYLYSCSSGCSLQSKLQASDAMSFDNFGFSVAVAGARVVVGADNKLQGTTASTGVAYFFDCAIATSCTQVYELVTTGYSTGGDWVGFSVALTQSLAVVGIPNHTSGSAGNVGRVAVYALPAGQCPAQVLNHASYPVSSIGATAHGVCQSGYYGAPTRVCQANEQFGAETNPCQPNVANCPAQTYGFFNWPQTNVGSTATASCQAGYSGPSATRQCFANGWSTSISGGPCTRNQCTAASAGTAGNANWATTWSNGTPTSVTGTCVSGYTGTATRNCNPDGTWGTPSSSCTPGGNCPAQQIGFALWGSTAPGVLADGVCQSGWGMHNGLPPTRQCLNNGVWSNTISNFCDRLLCSATTVGSSSFPQVESFTEAAGTCAQGTSGVPRMYCDSTGNWVNPTGLCH